MEAQIDIIGVLQQPRPIYRTELQASNHWTIQFHSWFFLVVLQNILLWNCIMIVGYARVSTPDQKLEAQIDLLEKAGCEKIYTDVASARHPVAPVMIGRVFRK
mgnify:CR=1 FL=1